MDQNTKRIIDKATDVLGSVDKAMEWIDHVSATLGSTPRALALTDQGTARVLFHLGGISRHSID